MLTSVRAVLFDAVGTLIYSDPPVAEVYYNAGCANGSALSIAEIKKRFGRALARHFIAEQTDEASERCRWSRVVAEVFSDIDDTNSLFEQLWHHFSDHRHWTVYDDIHDTWHQLEARGMPVAIASNFDRRLLGIASHLTPLDRAQSIFFSAQLGYTKPHRQFFRSIERALQLRPDQLLLVGDDPINDHWGATQAGWHSLLLKRSGDVCGNCVITSPQSIFDVIA